VGRARHMPRRENVGGILHGTLVPLFSPVTSLGSGIVCSFLHAPSKSAGFVEPAFHQSRRPGRTGCDHPTGGSAPGRLSGHPRYAVAALGVSPACVDAIYGHGGARSNERLHRQGAIFAFCRGILPGEVGIQPERTTVDRTPLVADDRSFSTTPLGRESIHMARVKKSTDFASRAFSRISSRRRIGSGGILNSSELVGNLPAQRFAISSFMAVSPRGQPSSICPFAACLTTCSRTRVFLMVGCMEDQYGIACAFPQALQ